MSQQAAEVITDNDTGPQALWKIIRAFAMQALADEAAELREENDRLGQENLRLSVENKALQNEVTRNAAVSTIHAGDISKMEDSLKEWVRSNFREKSHDK